MTNGEVRELPELISTVESEDNDSDAKLNKLCNNDSSSEDENVNLSVTTTML